MSFITIGCFALSLLSYVLIGMWSSRYKQDTADDYLLASRSVHPWLVALSAVATANSGFMFIGLIGATYAAGVSSMWIPVGWVVGDLIAWLCRLPEKIRRESEISNATTVPSFLGFHQTPGRERPVTMIAGLLTLLFLSTYAAAQLAAGGKTLHVLLGWDMWVGVFLGAIIVMVYCFSGGLRASIWTDAAQAIVMLAALLIFLGCAIDAAGGIVPMWHTLASMDPRLVEWMPRNLQFGFALYALSWCATGFGVIGQPHIIIRAMAIDSPSHFRRALPLYFSLNLAYNVLAVGIGLAARALIPHIDGFDPELAMPTLAMQILPQALLGLILAGLFAASMSTADSQVLACSAALTQDLFPRIGQRYGMLKLSTVIVTGIVTCMALIGNSVFNLVVMSWSALAAGFTPMMIVRATGRTIPPTLGALMIVTGVGTVMLWRYGLGLSEHIFDVLPGMLAGGATYLIGSMQLGRITQQSPHRASYSSRM